MHSVMRISGVHDLAIVGGGPAGVACALQAQREGLDLVLIDDKGIGGLLGAARRIDNLPGYARGIAGHKLARLYAQQLKQRRISVLMQRVARLELQAGVFSLHCTDGLLVQSHSVFIATGTRPCAAKIDGESVPESALVHRDLRGFSAAVAGTDCLVVGGGDAAFDTAMALADRKARVVLAIRSTMPRANQALLDECAQHTVAVRTGCTVHNLCLQQNCLRVTLAEGPATQRDALFAHAFFCFGRVPNLDLLASVPVRQRRVQTDVGGLFMGGDVLHAHDRFIAIAQGDGQKAARLALAYLQQLTASSAPEANPE